MTTPTETEGTAAGAMEREAEGEAEKAARETAGGTTDCTST